ncbi:MAG: hypothetical protein QXM43_00930 [Desulfurococcaceae archaeon]
MVFLIFLIPLFSNLIFVLQSSSSTTPPEVTIFFDDFESYAIGTFPSAGGWEIVWNGRGNEYQYVSNLHSYSQTQSFHLWGQTGWSSVMQRRFSTDAPVIGYEFAIFFQSKASDHQDYPGFFRRGAEGQTWGTYYAVVIFDHKDGKIKAEDGTILGDWSPKTWYRVKAILDRRSKTYSVWINGELRGSNMRIRMEHPELIDAIALTSAWPGQEVYYDDVRVFAVRGEEEQYYLRVYFSSSAINGQTLSGSNPEIRVSPGQRIRGFLDVVVDNNRGGPWITPVIGTASWIRGSFRCISYNAPTGVSIQRYEFDLTAPGTPGTYYIGVFAGWMYTCDEVASNDHPPNYGDGDDVWDMPSQGWEEVITNGQASRGPYRMPGRAIRIIVEQQVGCLLDIWTDKGGIGCGVDDGKYRLFEEFYLYFKSSVRACGPCIKFIGPYGEIGLGCMTFCIEPGRTYRIGPIYFNEERDIGEWTVIIEATYDNGKIGDSMKLWVLLEEAPCKLEITSVEFPSYVSVGEEFRLVAKVKNVGSSTVCITPYGLGVDWSPAEYLEEHPLLCGVPPQELRPGESYTVVHCGWFKALKPGHVKMTIKFGACPAITPSGEGICNCILDVSGCEVIKEIEITIVEQPRITITTFTTVTTTTYLTKTEHTTIGGSTVTQYITASAFTTFTETSTIVKWTTITITDNVYTKTYCITIVRTVTNTTTQTTTTTIVKGAFAGIVLSSAVAGLIRKIGRRIMR